VRSSAPGTPFAYVNKRLTGLVEALLEGAQVGPGDAVLDYGSADSPYRHLLPAGVRFVAADLPGNPDADAELRPDGTLPLPDAAVDLVLSTQVLEHVEDPQLYLSECRRVLEPGGQLIVSTHGMMYYHRDPEDYWRWTCAGLRKLLEDQGFTVPEMRGALGLAAASLQILQDGTYLRLPRRLHRPTLRVSQRLIALADRLDTDETRVLNGLVLAARAVRS
jgi:SAM-dependent methyltransferase